MSKSEGKTFRGPLYVIHKDDVGVGGFLCPPGHPNLHYAVYAYYKGRRKQSPDAIASLNSVLASDNVPEAVRQRAQRIMDEAQLTCSERWVRSVYGYFRHSYAPESGSRNVAESLSSNQLRCQCGEEFVSRHQLERHLERNGAPEISAHREVTVAYPPERHLGYLTVKEYFPEHAPRLDLIADPGRGYGSYPCAKCGQRVQYEAREDALCVISGGYGWKADPVCPKGGAHLLEGETGDPVTPGQDKESGE